MADFRMGSYLRKEQYTEGSWNDFVKKFYDSGKKKVRNPNPKGKEEVTFNTALKNPSFKNQVNREYKKYLKSLDKKKASWHSARHVMAATLPATRKMRSIVAGLAMRLVEHHPGRIQFQGATSRVPLQASVLGRVQGYPGSIVKLEAQWDAPRPAVSLRVALGRRKFSRLGHFKIEKDPLQVVARFERSVSQDLRDWLDLVT